MTFISRSHCHLRPWDQPHETHQVSSPDPNPLSGDIVLSLIPRPRPQKEKRVWYTLIRLVHFWILTRLSVTPCGLHAIIMTLWYGQLLLRMRRYHAKNDACVVMTIAWPCVPQKALNVPDSFLLLGVGSGDKTNGFLVVQTCDFLPIVRTHTSVDYKLLLMIWPYPTLIRYHQLLVGHCIQVLCIVEQYPCQLHQICLLAREGNNAHTCYYY